MNTYSFIKENGDWHIEYTETPSDFGKEDLLLKEGAGPLLDFLSKGKKKLILTIDRAPFKNHLELELIFACHAPKGGGYYRLLNETGRVLVEELWLCDVPLFVFGDIPEHIYLKKEKQLSPSGVVQETGLQKETS